MLAAGLMFFLASFTRHEMTLTIVFLLLGSGFLFRTVGSRLCELSPAYGVYNNCLCAIMQPAHKESP